MDWFQFLANKQLSKEQFDAYFFAHIPLRCVSLRYVLKSEIASQKIAKLRKDFLIFCHNGPPESSKCSVPSSKQKSGAECRPPHRSPCRWQPSLCQLPGQLEPRLPQQVPVAQKTEKHHPNLTPKPHPMQTHKQLNTITKTAAGRCS